MADERDLELLDDYLTNRMSGRGRSAFEQKLKADPDLQHELALQKRLIEGIKGARVAELKSMLNNVPVPPAGTGSLVATKILLGTVATIVIAGAAYLFLQKDQTIIPAPQTKTEEPIPSAKPPESKAVPEVESQQEEEEPVQGQQRVESDRNQTSAGTEHSKPSLAKKPDPLSAPAGKKNEKSEGPVPDVFTPENEENTSADGNGTTGGPNLTPVSSSLVVETTRNNRRYTFHYQFREGNLFLYGPFEKNLYEIMEFFADEKRTVFLYYKDRYYLLPEADEQIRPLSAISDPALLQKLKEYRNSK